MEWIDWLLHSGRYLTAAVALSSALLASGHAVIWKRDLRSALLWIVVIWLVPIAGPLLYLVLGINRIERRAKTLRRFPPLQACGSMSARGIKSDPDENFERLRWTLRGALAVARQSVRILNPYFLPDGALISARSIASMRGVVVDIVVPQRNEFTFLKWAMNGSLWQLLSRGCRVWLAAGPFDHSKLLLVDGIWSLFGPANWDARSLRLNFEFNVECYSPDLGERLDALVESKRATAHRVTLEEMDDRPLLVKLRDGIARLFTPYL